MIVWGFESVLKRRYMYALSDGVCFVRLFLLPFRCWTSLSREYTALSAHHDSYDFSVAWTRDTACIRCTARMLLGINICLLKQFYDVRQSLILASMLLLRLEPHDTFDSYVSFPP